jgi:predicted N-acyltransferase
LTVWDGSRLEAACPLYSKLHSYGEYIFDWSWADAYERHGVPYYPKLSAASPFTPATGAKVLVRPGGDVGDAYDRILGGALALMAETKQSSLHFLFLDPGELPHFERAGFILRHSFQYHWHNQNYQSFDDFLSRLKPKKRRQIVRERSQLAGVGLEFKVVTGDELTAQHAEMFYPLYRATTDKMRAIPYLTPDFFKRVFTTMKQHVVLMFAEDQDGVVGAALYYRKGTSLFGRYWGASRDVRNLHFELCYYQPIEWAIANGLKLFEAGAQGEHKIARGFVPALTYSAHWIAHPEFRVAIAAFVRDEKAAIEAAFADMAPHLAYVN